MKLEGRQRADTTTLVKGTMTWAKNIFAIAVGVVGVLAGGTVPVTFAQTSIVASFNVEAVVSVEVFDSGTANATFKSVGLVSFSCSNGSWQINHTLQSMEDVKHPSEKTPAGTVVNCKPIPDGIRYYYVFPSKSQETNDSNEKALGSAIAEPFFHPPPHQPELLASWLCYCPNPQLPIIDSKQKIMRRFIHDDLVNDPNNSGKYSASYLKSGQAFLSDLTISNDGTTWIHDDGSNCVTKFDPPFDRGFMELSYKVSAVTNYNGMVFPQQATLSYYLPKINAKNGRDVYLFRLVRINTQRIGRGVSAIPSVPARLYAQDKRFLNLKPGVIVGYFVKNDEWVPVRSPEMKAISKVFDNPERH
ncbi:MAG: hypothetical protein NTZ16_13480 [Verrucomicrobia bacterium]|nr:hypothetical protein [Verrucomicrobiota bacterium]